MSTDNDVRPFDVSFSQLTGIPYCSIVLTIINQSTEKAISFASKAEYDFKNEQADIETVHRFPLILIRNSILL
jgi:hypothetical protein